MVALTQLQHEASLINNSINVLLGLSVGLKFYEIKYFQLLWSLKVKVNFWLN